MIGLTGISFVTFELSPNGDTTTLQLTHKGVETFAAHGSDFAKSSFTEGWNYITGTSLAKYLEAN